MEGMVYGMEWYWVLLAGIGFGAFESVWRRWFGGGFEYRWLKWCDHRPIKHAVNIAAIFAVVHFLKGASWRWSLYAALVMQLLFWTLTFGMYFDIGRAGRPVTEDDIKAYNKPWFAPILNWAFPDEHRYTPFYDYMGMFIRFTWPLLLVFWMPQFDSGLLMLGTIVAISYGLGWVGYEKSLIKKIGATEFGEFAAGFATGFLVVVNGARMW